eukprot:13126858-Alexandrium_andersonii.AAC.1
MKKFRYDRLVASCFSGTVHEPNIYKLQVQQVQLYKKRWFVVVLFLRSVLPAVPVLRTAWVAEKFRRGSDD